MATTTPIGQDNALTWLDWRDADAELIDFVAGLIDLRRRYPQLRRRNWLTGQAVGDDQPDVVWWHPAGRAMRVADWQSKKLGAFGMQLAAEIIAVGATQDTETLLCLFNRDEIPVSFLLPGEAVWWQVFDSSAQAPCARLQREKTSLVPARSVQILSRQAGSLSDA